MRNLFVALILIAVGGTLVPGTQLYAFSQMTAVPSISAATAKEWTGNYAYENAIGEVPSGSGTHAVVTYRLLIPKNVSLPATLLIDGFQSEERLRCAIVGNDKRLEIHFVSFANGKVVNGYGVVVYRPNDLLFTLERAESDGARALITEWKSLKPDGVLNARGTYLVRVARFQRSAVKGR